MKKLIILAAILFLLPFSTHASDISAKNPKTANAFLRWNLTLDDAERLSRYDVLILDMENQVNNPELLKRIRQLNPSVTILAYVSSQEIRHDTAIHPEVTLRQKMFARLPESWYLRDNNNFKISFWDKTWMINITGSAPLDKGERFNDYLPRFIDEEILSTGLWDGIFFDNLWDSINWLNNGNVDIDNDGQIELAAELNNTWQDGVKKILSKTRARVGYDYILMANSSSFKDYQPYLNGRMFEDFPSPYEQDGTWQGNINSYQEIKNYNVKPNIYIFNSTNTPKDNYSKMRYGLASSLLFNDVYFSFDNSVYDHGQTWWYDEYDFSLGLALNSAYKLDYDKNIQNVWRRDFANGMVLVNNSLSEQTFDIESGYRKLYGRQDSVVNSGGELTRVTIGPRDALVLETVLGVQNLYLKNYYRYQVYNLNGEQIYNNYQWGSDTYKNGELVKPEKNNKASKIKERKVILNGVRVEGSPTSTKANIKIYNAKNKMVGAFKAYPDNLKSGVRVALGDINGDKQLEIAVLPVYGQPNLKIFSLKGKLLKEYWLGFTSDRYFYDLSMADVNNDKLAEILVTKW
ncbi:MAG: putative glycoside hydrolase [Candidatus Falkowbacteria bacterium]